MNGFYKKASRRSYAFGAWARRLSESAPSIANPFGKSTAEDLKGLDTQTFLEVFEGVTQAQIHRTDLDSGLDMIAALSGQTQFLNSNGEARRALKENSIAVNKQKVQEDYILTAQDLIDGQYILLQRGKKNYFILHIVD